MLVLCQLHILCVTAMLGKRTSFASKFGEDIPEAKRFRHNIQDLYLNNEISAQRFQGLMQDASAAGTQHVEDLAGASRQGRHWKNLARDLLRKMVRNKRNRWPSPYMAPIKVWDTKAQREATIMLPMLLPHEIARNLAKEAHSRQALLCQEGLCASTKAHVLKVATELGVEAASLLCFSLWGDGCPCNWDRSQSMEILSLLLPGQSNSQKQLRVPVTCINKKFLLKGETWEQILAVMSWSFQQLAIGEHPRSRHDGSDWLASDRCRAKLAGQPLGVQGILAEVKGDWAFFKSVFRFPQHNQKDGCCWLCSCVPAEIRDCGSSAAWRTNRLGHWELMRRMANRGERPSAIFSCPGL
jgi:hypothetical protein